MFFSFFSLFFSSPFFISDHIGAILHNKPALLSVTTARCVENVDTSVVVSDRPAPGLPNESGRNNTPQWDCTLAGLHGLARCMLVPRRLDTGRFRP